MTNYFDVDAMSASVIKAGKKSMLKMDHAKNNKSVSTSAMAKGTLFHEALLEPELFEKRVTFSCRRRTKEHTALIAEYGENGVAKEKEYNDAKQIADVIKKHPMVIKHGLFQGGEAEKEIYWQEALENGKLIECKCKVDYSAEEKDYMIEYKTTGDLENFSKTSARMSYQLQLGWYWRGACQAAGKKMKVFIVAQEQSAPFDVAVFEVPQLMLKKWFMETLEIVKKYQSGDRSGRFPELMTFELPPWADDTADMEIDEVNF